MLFLRALVALAAAVSSIDASPLRERATTFVQPSLDPFYRAPANLSAYKAGQIIRERTIETEVTKTRLQTQLLYATVDGVGRQDATVATVLAPANVAAGTPKIFSLQSPQDSAAYDCAASFNLLKGSTSNASSSGSVLVTALADAAINKGFYVVIADFQQSRSGFVVGLTEGRGVLDGIRALLNHKPTLPDGTGHSILLNGYSGGAHATHWAAQIAAAYAPALNIVGVVSGGLPVIPKDLLVGLSSSLFAGFAMGSLAGYMATYDDLNTYTRSILHPNGTEAVDFLQAYACVPQELQTFALKDIFSYTTKSQKEILANPIVSRRLAENVLGAPGSPVIPYPQYIYSGILDQVIPNKGVTDYVNEQCRRGARINYSTDLFAEHITEQIQQFMPQFQWSVDALEGKVANVSGCQRKDNLVSLLPQLFTDYGKKLVGPDALRKVSSFQKMTRR